MKIKIIKDIPGYKAGYETDERTMSIHSLNGFDYTCEGLITCGFAEEIKDDIDIEAIREKYKLFSVHMNNFDKEKTHSWEFLPALNEDEMVFINAYRIVKEVIDQFNCDWKPDWEKSISERKYTPSYDYHDKKWYIQSTGFHIENIFPPCKNREDCQKVIELCEPELKVLFGVK